jgi:argininosuccinate lyase
MTEVNNSFPHPVYEQYVLQPYFKDALKYYYGPILAANKAHAVMLYRSGIIELENAKALLLVLLDIESVSRQPPLQIGCGGSVFTSENRLIDATGPVYGGIFNGPPEMI